MPPQWESSQRGRSVVTLNNKPWLRARRALKGYLSLNNSIVFLFMLKRLQVAVPDGAQLCSGGNMNTSKGGSDNLWNKILPISDTFHQRQLRTYSYLWQCWGSCLCIYFRDINSPVFCGDKFCYFTISGDQWWLISFVMMSWPYLARHLAECDEEAGDLVNSLEERGEDVVRDF